MSRPTKMMLALALGALAGGLLHGQDLPGVAEAHSHVLQPLGQLFLRLLFLTVVPLVFSALVLGVYELARGAREGIAGPNLGHVAGWTLAMTLVASSLSVIIGLGLVETLRPGDGFHLDPSQVAAQKAALQSVQQNAEKATSFGQAVVDLVPRNPVDVAARALSGEMLPFMVFALLFGAALAARPMTPGAGTPGAGTPVLVKVLEDILGAAMQLVDFAMRLAPLGVFAIVFGTLFQHGVGVLLPLFKYVAVVVLGLSLQQFVVYPLMLRGLGGRSPWPFFSRCRTVLLYAFSTASSNATLPTALRAAEHDLGLSPRVARFVLTVGATANQNGTALFEGVTVLFLAQVYGIDLTLAQQAQVVGMSILAGIGTAGVPGGSLPLVLLLLQQVGVPPEGLGLILGADRFLDMCRTTVNVAGDLVVAAIVDKRTGGAVVLENAVE